MPSRSASPSVAVCLETAHALADAAGRVILPHFRSAIAVVDKGTTGFDPVTVADTAAEEAMRALIAERHPGHGIVGEEFDDVAGAGRYNWILDPIDGTRAFICGYPLWGTLIGLFDGDAPVVGMMDQPFTRERFWATPAGKAKAALYRGPDGATRHLATRACPSLAAATLASTSPDMFRTPAQRASFAALSDRVKLTRYGGDCYAYCMLAAGQVDLVVEASLKAVDIAPLIPIIEAAGGVVTTWSGGPAHAGGEVIATGDKALHAAALAVLAGR